MAFVKLRNPGEVLHNCGSVIDDLCEDFYNLDSNKQIVLLLMLYEFLEVKYGEPDGNGGIDWHKANEGKSIQYRKSLEMVISAGYRLCHSYGTDKQKGFWNLAWDDEHIENILKDEGFMIR